MILKEVLDKTTQFFKEKKIETARLDSEILISKALGLRRIDLYLKFEQTLSDQEIQQCRDFVKRRSQGEPVAYILGKKDFYNLSFRVDSRVLVPRPETELMVEVALKWMKSKDQESFQVADLGCGSGCIGLTIAKMESRSMVTLMDASEGAIEVTAANQKELMLESQSQIIKSTVIDFSFEKNQFDLILANPPYIDTEDQLIQESVKKFEPASALFADDNGFSEIRNWSKKSISALKPGGMMIFEIGMNQGDKAQAHFESLGAFDSVRVLKDLAGLDRFVLGEKRHG